MAKVMDKEENFNFKPYVFTPPGIHKVQMFEEVNSKIALAPEMSISVKARLMLIVGAHICSRSKWSTAREQ